MKPLRLAGWENGRVDMVDVFFFFKSEGQTKTILFHDLFLKQSLFVHVAMGSKPWFLSQRAVAESLAGYCRGLLTRSHNHLEGLDS